jgi:hypothetical protein
MYTDIEPMMTFRLTTRIDYIPYLRLVNFSYGVIYDVMGRAPKETWKESKKRNRKEPMYQLMSQLFWEQSRARRYVKQQGNLPSLSNGRQRNSYGLVDSQWTDGSSFAIVLGSGIRYAGQSMKGISKSVPPDKSVCKSLRNLNP